MIFVYPVGGLSLYFFLLFINRHEIMSDRTKATPIVDPNVGVEEQRWSLIGARRNSFASDDDYSTSVRFDVPNVRPPGVLRRRNTLRKLLELANKTKITTKPVISTKDKLMSPTLSQMDTSRGRKNLVNFEKAAKHKSSPYSSQRDTIDRRSPINSQKPKRQGAAVSTTMDSSLTKKALEQENDHQPKASMKWEANPLVTAALNELGSSFGSVEERQKEREAEHQLAMAVAAALESDKFKDLNARATVSSMSPSPKIRSSKKVSVESIKQPAIEDPFNVMGRRKSLTPKLGSPKYGSRTPNRTPPLSPRGSLPGRESMLNDHMPSEKSHGSHSTVLSSVPFADKDLYAKRPSISLPTNR